ncbi:hypothetical protein SKAU_G00265870 [Synaphobranchus kaupii]|uniref:Uncharacterized protein n=1 Tax=Synaphobranchus kaupii TaxID=118154 RepID=A0A9Q1IN07_SYNKA|nr:hypothetical protein SKAU_G00265870 [Synaphobranchus kaupii]
MGAITGLHTIHGLSLDQKDSGSQLLSGEAIFRMPRFPCLPNGRGFGAGLFPLHSPLLRESWLEPPSRQSGATPVQDVGGADGRTTGSPARRAVSGHHPEPRVAQGPLEPPWQSVSPQARELGERPHIWRCCEPVLWTTGPGTGAKCQAHRPRVLETSLASGHRTVLRQRARNLFSAGPGTENPMHLPALRSPALDRRCGTVLKCRAHSPKYRDPTPISDKCKVQRRRARNLWVSPRPGARKPIHLPVLRSPALGHRPEMLRLLEVHTFASAAKPHFGPQVRGQSRNVRGNVLSIETPAASLRTTPFSGTGPETSESRQTREPKSPYIFRCCGALLWTTGAGRS